MFWQNCSKFLVDATPDKSIEYPCVKNIKENRINNDCEFAFKTDKKKKFLQKHRKSLTMRCYTSDLYLQRST